MQCLDMLPLLIWSELGRLAIGVHRVYAELMWWDAAAQASSVLGLEPSMLRAPRYELEPIQMQPTHKPSYCQAIRIARMGARRPALYAHLMGAEPVASHADLIVWQPHVLPRSVPLHPHPHVQPCVASPSSALSLRQHCATTVLPTAYATRRAACIMKRCPNNVHHTTCHVLTTGSCAALPNRTKL